MKVRNSFVTNSSSSSYIVSVNKDKKQNMLDFYDIVQDLGGYETDEPHLFCTEKDLNNYVKEEYGKSLPEIINSDEYYAETYGGMLKKIKDGDIVLQQYVSYGQEELYEKLMQYVLKDYKLDKDY